MKKIIILFIVVVFIAGCNNNRGWSSADRRKMIADCIKLSQGTVIEDKAKSYCECMQPIMEAKYPTVAEANRVTAENVQTPEMLNAAKKCLGLGDNNNDDNNNNNNRNDNLNNNDDYNQGNNWSNADKQKYMNECVPSAVNSGSDQQTANTYCNCTLNKLQKKYKSYADAQNSMTNDELTAIQQECAQGKNNDQ